MRPLLSIWISPRKTFEYLSTRDESENREILNILSALIAIGLGIPRLGEIIKASDNNRFIVLIIGIAFCSLIGILIIKILFALMYWTIGKILKGQATKNQVQLVVVYSMIPYLIYLAIGLILIIPAIITQNMELVCYRHPFTYYVVWLLATRNLIYGLSYFNKFSNGYAFINILIPVGVIELIRLIITNWRS